MKIKKRILIFPLMILLTGSCANMGKKIVFQPDPRQEQEKSARTGGIIESQNSSIPEWFRAFIDLGISGIESLDPYKNRYIFMGKNQGKNFSALEQWAAGFSTAQDFPRLAAARIEDRLLASAALYPDDEYGQYFEVLIKNASDAEYEGAVKEENFWIKRQPASNDAAASTEPEIGGEGLDIYEFFVLISIDKTMLQTQIKQLMADVKTAARPTRAQNAAINRIKQNFFEGF